MSEFGHYKKIGDPDKRKKAENWRIAIGLQQVDGLTPSQNLIKIATDNIEGKISVKEAEQQVAAYYRQNPPSTPDEQSKREADEVSSRINNLLSKNAFTFSPVEYIAIHKHLFTKILDVKTAGKLRNYDITKAEPILQGDTVQYGSALNLRAMLDYDLAQEKKFSYKGLSKKKAVLHVAKFTSSLWQIHPFGEGNTRTTAVFLIKYLRLLGFKADNALFEENALYFRNALVRANYQNLEYGIAQTTEYLDRFFGNLLFGEKHTLKNRDLLILQAPERILSMDKIGQIKQLVSEINRLHLAFSNDYFETGKIEKINLAKTIAHVPVHHVYRYRLTLHESINDYLMAADIDIRYFYRVKTRESIDDKIARFAAREDQYPVNNWLNDIFGARIVLNDAEIQSVMDVLDGWQDELSLKNWYLRDKEGYRGLHVYFKNKSNFFFPWELQIWNAKDLQSNIDNHEKFKRNFVW